jgi:hypothetical protein
MASSLIYSGERFKGSAMALLRCTIQEMAHGGKPPQRDTSAAIQGYKRRASPPTPCPLLTKSDPHLVATFAMQFI